MGTRSFVRSIFNYKAKGKKEKTRFHSLNSHSKSSTGSRWKRKCHWSNGRTADVSIGIGGKRNEIPLISATTRIDRCEDRREKTDDRAQRTEGDQQRIENQFILLPGRSRGVARFLRIVLNGNDASDEQIKRQNRRKNGQCSKTDDRSSGSFACG